MVRLRNCETPTGFAAENDTALSTMPPNRNGREKRMQRLMLRLLAALTVLIGVAGASEAQQQPAPQAAPKDVRVVTRVLPPMVVDRGGSLTGFSIDLWNEISDRLRLRTTYQPAPDVGALLAEVRNGKVDLGIAAISITAARETEFDFSQPMMNAGLQIMVRGAGKDGDSNPLKDLLSLLFSWTSLAWLGIAALLVLIPAHVIWYLERDHPHGIIPTRDYIPGIFYALYWAAGTLATQAESAPKHWIGRVVALLWMFTGVVFVALYTAQLAATLTVQQISGGINGPDDLAGKRVATTRGSTAANVVRGLGAQVVEVGQITEAYQALERKTVDAVVFDAPVLLYYAATEGKGKVATVGAPFRKEDYGIVFPRGNPLRNDVNVTLLRMREDGTYQRLYDKWFGVQK
jgi:polar amino acid transport system substrate-binding protein